MTPHVAINDLKGTTLEVTVTITRRFRLRIAVALWLIRLAGRILGSTVKINQEDNNG